MKRTPLARKAQMARRPFTAKPPTKAATAPRPPRKPPRDTGPSREVRALVLDRADGCCEVCGLLLYADGRWLGPYSVHHRRPRGAGGDKRPDTNSPANLLLVCGSATTPGGCHLLIESNRAHALNLGWLVLRNGDQNPAETPLQLHAYPGDWSLLRHDGTVAEWVL